MNRRFRVSIALVVCAAALCSAAPAQAQVSIIKGPYLQDVTRTSITVMWETGEPGPSLVEYWLVSEPAQRQTVEASQTVKIHEVPLTGLPPDTQYGYRIASGSITSEPGSFWTAPGRSVPFRFAVWGDTQSHPEQHRAVAVAMLKSRPKFAVHVGDEVGNGDSYEGWGTEFFGPAAKLFANVPFFVAIGNHEGNSHWFYDLHSQPPPENYCSFDYGNSHFIIIDTNQNYAPQSEQYRWLAQDLESSACKRARWRFAFFHHPSYSEGWDNPGYDGEPNVRKYLMPLFEKHGLTMAFSGHTHGYERGRYNGVYYMISGGGGGALDRWYRDFGHIAVSRFEHHFCQVDVTDNEVRLKAVTPSGKVLDSFVVRPGSR